MKRYSYGLLSILIIVCGLVNGKERPAQIHTPTSIGHNGSEYILHDSEQDQSPQGREPITLFFEDFEDDSSTALWQTDDGWELTDSDYWSPTHSFNSPNDGSGRQRCNYSYRQCGSQGHGCVVRSRHRRQ